MLLDHTNPRSLAGVLRRLRMEIDKLPGEPASLQALRVLLPAQGAGIDLPQLQGADDKAVAARLQALAQQLAADAGELAERVGRQYFTPVHGLDHRV